MEISETLPLTSSSPLPATAKPTGTLAFLAAHPSAFGFGAAVLVLTSVLAVYARAAGPPALPKYSYPEQVFTVLGADPNTQLTVSWAVSSSDGASMAGAFPRVAYGLGASSTALPLSAPASCTWYSTTPDQTFEYAAYTSPLLCSATITIPSSSPGTVVRYVAGDDIHGFSSVRATATAPIPGTPGVRLAVLGDLGTTANSTSTLASILASHANAPFASALLVGDLSYADGSQPVWDEWGRLVDPLASTLPMWTAVGNHDWFDTIAAPCDYKTPPYCSYTFTAFTARTHNPTATLPATADTLFFSVNLGLLHIVVLQAYCTNMTATSTQPCLAAGSAQAEWLKGDLASVKREVTPWVVVAFHQPFVNSNKAHPMNTEGAPIRAALEEVLFSGGVDLVLSGHVHAYERSCRVHNLECTGNATGPVYITIGDGGNRELLATSWLDPQPSWSLVRSATYGHGEVTAVNASHLHWVWNNNPDLLPREMDQVWLVKGEAGQVGGGETLQPKLRSR